MTKNFDRASTRTIQRIIENAANAALKAHGLAASLEMKSFGSNAVNYVMTVAYGDEVKLEDTPAGRAFKVNARWLGMKEEDLGKMFVGEKGVRYKITGAEPNRRKNPIVGERVADGAPFVFPVDYVRRRLAA